MRVSTGGPGGPPRGPSALRADGAAPGHHRSRRRRLAAAGAVFLLAILSVTTGATSSSAAPALSAQVDKQVLTEIAQNGSTDILVYLREQADLSKADSVKTKAARTTYVFDQLTATASRSQRELVGELSARKVSYKSFWIANVILLKADKALVDAIAGRSDVASIGPVKQHKLIEPKELSLTDARINTTEWGLNNIEAPRVWSEFGVRGEGIVVANIDTGADYTHPALSAKYRGNMGGGTFDHNYNWFDPSGICPTDAPCDNHGHGTHTMGTMVGDDGTGNQVGVAPGARFIAAKGCEINTCSDAALLASGQWVVAPTDLNGANPRPDLRPDVVNNSWGDVGGSNWYQPTIRAWVAAGIMPIFSNGNDGPSCDTAGSPGDNPEAYSAGAYDINNAIAGFSSRGESPLDGAIKPNIAAPGVNVRSSLPGGAYGNASGTSMAAPHVSGTVALIWSAAPTLRGNIAATRALLDDTATDVASLGCGGTADFNNNFGEGRLNAYQAVLAAPRGPTGRVTGVVTDSATSAPIAGVTVTGGTSTTTTGPDGRYALTVAAGEQTITASKFGYATQSVTITVPEGGAVTQNFALSPLPRVTVSGTVRDGSGQGWPLYARIQISGLAQPVWSNPATGRYSVVVPGNSSYTFTTTAVIPGYQTTTETVAVGATNTTHDIAVRVQPTCTVPGYSIGYGTPVLSEPFDSGLPAGWSVVKRSASGGQWAFNDPGARGNLTGGSGTFAMADSDFPGSGTTTDTDLVTASINLSAVPTPFLRFNSDFRDIGSEDFTDVDVSIDGGTTWTNVYHQTVSLRGPRVEELSLGPAGGQANVLIRFHYFGTWDWWWEVDNVQILPRSCNPTDGGLVVGFTTDRNTGAALNGVTVTSNNNPANKAVSAATPDDPNIPDGFYWMFSSLVGANPFTATKPPYADLTKTVNVANHSTVQADFALAASRLVVNPTTIESFQTLGQTRTTTFNVRNTGTAAATIELFERGGDFEILSRSGAPLRTFAVPGGVPKGHVTTRPGAVGAGAAPQVDPAWTTIANLPSALSDNAGVTLEGKVYSIGGAETGTDNQLLVYDPDGNAWTALPDMPTGRAKAQAVATGGKIYVFGGWQTNAPFAPVPTVDVYDPAASSWSTLAATNPKPRAAAGVALAGGKVYLVGGCVDGNCATAPDTTVFNPVTGAFEGGVAYPHSVAWQSCGGIADKVYCAGGIDADPFTDGFVFNPGTSTWSPIAGMPLDLWGSADAAAGGMLVMAGGVANGSSELTNRSIAYDPSTNAWTDLPNATFARARAAGACGFYKFGGWSAPFSGAPEAESLGGLEGCDESSDVPWLSETPTTFTLNPGQARNVTVTLSATTAAGVTQPGDYTAEIAFRSNSPYPVSAVGVTMHVLPPASWGKIQGTVTGVTCGGSSVGVPAFIRINSVTTPDIGYSVRANADGTYAFWLPRGRYQVIVAKDGWVPEVASARVQAGFVLTIDFSLEPFTPCPPTAMGGV